MGRLVIILKAIKYKKDSFCFLSFYPPDLDFQAACLLTLFFRLYVFRIFVSLVKRICLSKPRILDPFYNLNPHLLSSLLTPRSASFTAIGLTKH